jgi:hypothetical protein
MQAGRCRHSGLLQATTFRGSARLAQEPPPVYNESLHTGSTGADGLGSRRQSADPIALAKVMIDEGRL